MAWLTSTRNRGGTASRRNRQIAACASAIDVGSGVLTMTTWSAAAASMADPGPESRAGVDQHEVGLGLELAQFRDQPSRPLHEIFRAGSDGVCPGHDLDLARPVTTHRKSRNGPPARPPDRNAASSPHKRSRFASPISASTTTTR